MALAGLFPVMTVFPSVDGSLFLICLHVAFLWDRGQGACPHGAVIRLGHRSTLCLYSNFFTPSL